jgi:hypothetical protein
MERKKTGGRKAGTPNKVTGNIRAQIDLFLQKNWPEVQKKFNSLEPKDQLAFLEKLLKFSVPVLTNARIDVDSLPDNQLDEIINGLLRKLP